MSRLCDTASVLIRIYDWVQSTFNMRRSTIQDLPVDSPADLSLVSGLTCRLDERDLTCRSRLTPIHAVRSFDIIRLCRRPRRLEGYTSHHLPRLEDPFSAHALASIHPLVTRPA